MTRTLILLTCLASSAVAAAAQTPAPTPGAPVAAPAVQKPVAPAPLPAPATPWLTGDFEWQAMEKSLHAIDINKDLKMREAHDAMEQVHADMERLQKEFTFALPDLDMFHPSIEFALADAQVKIESIGQAPNKVVMFNTSNEAGLYSRGLQALSRHQYDQAVTLFDQVIAKKDARADAALYWKAFTHFKAAKSAEAQGAIAQLRKDYPQSHYLGDAKVLEADVRRLTGQPVNVEDQAVNDDIKILAIQAMQRTDPERALPLLEGVLTAANSLEVKKRAIYVLALSDDGRARPMLLRYAKGAGSPDLQPEAIRYLVSRSDRATVNADLKEIYESSQDPAVRRSVIEAYGAQTGRLNIQPLVVTGSGTGSFGGRATTAPARVGVGSTVVAPQDLWTLYQKEQDASLRTLMATVFGSMGATDQLLEIARTDKDVAVRQRVIRLLGSQATDRTGQTLVDLYGANQDRLIRTAVIQALGIQTNADGLVAIARKETNLELKRQIVSQLSSMASKSKPAADYLMEMLK